MSFSLSLWTCGCGRRLLDAKLSVEAKKRLPMLPLSWSPVAGSRAHGTYCYCGVFSLFLCCSTSQHLCILMDLSLTWATYGGISERANARSFVLRQSLSV